MKPSFEKYPRFLRCNNIQPSRKYNQYLIHPYTEGEVVKVAPITEQHSSVPDKSDDDFRKRWVKIYRKDENGNYVLPYVAEWAIFELLTTPVNKGKNCLPLKT